MKDLIMTESEKWIEYRTFTIESKCVFDSGKQDYITISVIAGNVYEAADIAKEWLLSRKAFRVQAVVGQKFGFPDCVLIKKGVVMND